MSTLLYVPPEGAAKGGALVLTALRFLLAAFFVFVATKNLTGDTTIAEDFRRFGYPDWFRVVTAAMQIAGALLLLRAQVAFFGAAILACVLLGAVWSHFRHDPPATLLAPVAFLVPTLAILWGLRPPALR